VKAVLLALFLSLATRSASAQVTEAWTLVDTAYADPQFDRAAWAAVHPATTDTGYDAVRALLRHLNDKAVGLVTADETTDLVAQLLGQRTVGVGLVPLLSLDVSGSTGQLIVVTPTIGTAADRAGLAPADEVVRIDGVATDSLDILAANRLLHGTAGSRVSVRVRSPAGVRDVTLVRDTIPAVRPVAHDTLLIGPGKQQVRYLALRQFTPGADSAIHDGLVAHGRPSAVILDLRDNPGGSLAATRAIAGFFIGPQPMALYQRSRGRVDTISATGNQITTARTVVIVNRATASAAEVLAAALQTSGRATVVGERTFGKALVHSVLPLDPHANVLLTIGRLQTMKAREILNVGVAPDVLVRSRGASRTLSGDLYIRRALVQLR
jgi:carboxyl-terminal processing protease